MTVTWRVREPADNTAGKLALAGYRPRFFVHAASGNLHLVPLVQT